MKLLTKNTDYAIRALVVLARNRGKYISARVISREERLPYQYTRRILQSLIKEGLVRSKEGGGGGFMLDKDPARVKILDVIRIFQGDIRLFDCMFRKKICRNRSTCVLRRYIQDIERIVAEKFGRGSIKTLLSK